MSKEKSIADQVNPDVLAQFLSGKECWVKLGTHSSRSMATFQCTGVNPTEQVIVPYWNGFQDYRSRMVITLHAVATAEDRTLRQLLQSLNEHELLVSCYCHLVKEFETQVKISQPDITLAFRIRQLGRFIPGRLVSGPTDQWPRFLKVTQEHLNDLKAAGFRKAAEKTQGSLLALDRAA